MWKWRRLGLALVVAASACTPPASAGIEARDAGPDAMRPTAAVGDGGAPSAASAAAAAASAARIDEAVPPASSDELNARARHLLEALAQDNPELASDIVFPRDAFSASRDAVDGAKAWEKVVNAPFSRSVHTLHKRLKYLERAQLVALELGHSLAQVTPKKKEWKKPLWKVRHSRLTVTIDGRTQRIEIAEMMGWRGAWYITKLR